MASRLREPTEQELRDLAITLAGEIDQRRSPVSDPQTRVEAANILATVVNRFSTDEPRRFGSSRVRNYDSYSDVVRNAGQYNAWMGQHVGTSRRNYDANRDYWENAVKDFFTGDLQPSAPNATHYHADFVSPDWSRAYDAVGQTGPHIFYNDEQYMGRPLGQSRPSYAMADLGVPSTSARSVPNPTSRPAIQPQVAAAPSIPAVRDRTLAGYIANSPGFEVKPGATIEGLSPAAQNMLDLMANSRGAGFTVTEGRRPQNASYGAVNSLHKSGNALDVRRRDRTPQQNLDALNAGLAGGGREVIFYPERLGGHVHLGTRPSGRFSVSGPIPDYARQSDIFNRLRSGEQPRISSMVPSPSPRPSRLPERQDPRATDFGPMAASSFPSRPSSPASLPSARRQMAETAPRPSENLPQRPQSRQINAPEFQAASLGPMPEPQFRVSPAGSYGTPRPRRSPTDFQYASTPRAPAPPQQPVATPQRAPATRQAPSMDAMLANYGARALQTADPFELAVPGPAAPPVPNPMARPPMPQMASVPNPMARPANIGPVAGPIAAPMPRSRARSVPNPVAARNQSRPGLFDGLFEALGANNWGQSFVNAPGQVVRAMTPNLSGLVQGSNLPSSNTANWQDDTGLPTYASITRRSAGTGASAHDAWADSLGSSFY